MPRLIRVKTKILGSSRDGKGKVTLTTGVADYSSVDSWEPQDDIYIIGTHLNLEFDVRDAHTNADTEVKGLVSVTTSNYERDGEINRIEAQQTWNAILKTGDASRKQLVCMFPPGYGFYIPYGNSIGLDSFLYYLGAGGTLDTFQSAIIYYVEA